MRRKSERVKDKDKSVEKKSERNPKKSRRSRRRKKSSSTSPEESESDEYDTSFKSSKDDTEEESLSGRSISGKNRSSHTEADKPTDVSVVDIEAEEKESPQTSSGRTRRHSKKQSADEVEEGQPEADHNENKEGKVEGTEAVVETPDKHKESDSKSSVWQVKSADCSGGEIKKLKLCIVRPPEPAEPAPRKRKKLSRMSHREVTEASAEEADDTAAAHNSPDVKQKSRKSASTVTEEKSEGGEIHESEGKKARSEESSEDEQGGNDSSEEIPLPIKASVDKLQEENESCQDTSSLAIKQDARDPFNKLVKEKETCDSTLQEGSKSAVDNKPIDSSKSIDCARKSPPSQDPTDKLMIEDSSSKVQPEDCHGSSKERNGNDPIGKLIVHDVHVLSEQIAKPCDLSKKIPNIPSEGFSKALDNSEKKSDVRDSSEAAAKGHDTSEKIAKSRDPSEERGDGFPERKSKARATLIERSSSKDSSEKRPTILNSSTKILLSRGSSLKKSKSHDSSDSEEERLNYRKLHENKKKSHHLIRHTSDTRSKEHDSVEKMLDISLPPRENKIKTKSLDEPRDRQNSSKGTKHTSVTKDSKTKEVSGEILRLDRRKYRISGNEEIAEDRQPVTVEKPQVREKISLKRSFSHVNDAQNITEGGKMKVQDGDNPDQSITSDDKVPEILPNLTRKRRWGASKTSSAVKKPTLSISSDSLKHLIPEAKPLPISEVQLTEEEDDEEEEGEVLDRVREPIEKDVEVEVEKDGDEEVHTNKLAEEKKLLFPLPMVPDPPEGKPGTVRKISIVSADVARLQRSPSPARHRASNVLFVTNLVRPFTVNQLRELLARTGTIVDGGFWIDKIKSKCYVQYESETEARETRHALHGVRWPVSNPKQLCVDYAKKEDMDLARDLSEGNHIPRKTEPLKMDRIDGWLGDQGRDKDREHILREDRERDRVRGKERHALGPMEVLEKSREAKMATSIREWDLGKMDLGPYDDRELHREERNREKERRVRKERSHRSVTPRELPGRKMRRKDEDAPAKLLDDLFKKTKVTPCVYWLPLTADQIVVKEEMRRKHMAEHERRMAEMRKAERERQRARMQGRTSQRRFEERDREKRRHRSLSGSPKK